MKQEIQAKLDQVFEKKRQVDVSAAQAKSAQEQREEAAVSKFKELRETVIRPTMQQFADYLGTKGHAATIVGEEERYDGAGTNKRPSMTLRISPSSDAPQQYSSHGQNAHFQVILDKATSKAWFHESTMTPNRGGHAGKCGEADLDELTGDLLEPFITKTIASIFG